MKVAKMASALAQLRPVKEAAEAKREWTYVGSRLFGVSRIKLDHVGLMLA